MRSMARMALAALALGASAHADLLLSDYATVTADSAATSSVYGIYTYSNPASWATATVPVAGSLKVAATFASEGTEGYSAMLGLMHPFRPDWSGMDLTSLQAIEFEIKTSVKPTDGWEFSFGSPIYGDLANQGTVLMTQFSVPSANVWTKVYITPDMFAYPSWFCDDVMKPCPPITLADVLNGTTNLQISPRTKYLKAGTIGGSFCTACVGPSTPAITFEIKNINIVGYETPQPPPPPVDLSGCDDTGASLVLDPANTKSNARLGIAWKAYSDTNFDVNSAYDPRRGSSLATVDLGVPGTAFLSASLNKQVPDWWYNYTNAEAGWAGLRLGTVGGKVPDLRGLKNVSFTVKPKLWSFYTELVFKVITEGVAEADAHQVVIPEAYLTGERVGERICIGPEDLSQPASVYAPVALDPARILGFAWETRIANRPDSWYVSSAFNQFRLGGITLGGLGAPIQPMKAAAK